MTKRKPFKSNRIFKDFSISNTRVYTIWEGIIQRGTNPDNKDYYKYGKIGRGVCDEWRSSKAFYEWAMSNGYKDDLQLDRIDNTKGYSPDNCRWATRRQQNINKINNRMITYKEETKPLTVWCKELGLKEKRTATRLDLGWSPEEAFEKPVGYRHKPHELTKRVWGRKTYFTKEVLI